MYEDIYQCYLDCMVMFGFVGVDCMQLIQRLRHEVEAAFNQYFQARQDQDYKTVVALESASGTMNTNSDGSFHKPLNTSNQNQIGRHLSFGAHLGNAVSS